MSVQVTFLAHGENGPYSKTAKYNASSWDIDSKGNLTVGDSLGNPEASYAEGKWDNVVKDSSDDDED